MSKDGRQPFRHLDIPMNFPLPFINNQLVSFSYQQGNYNSSASSQSASAANFRKRRSEDMDNKDFRPRSVENHAPVVTLESSHLVSPSVSDSQSTLGKHVVGHGAWDSYATLPAHLSSGISQRFRQCSLKQPANYNAPSLFFDQSFWQKYQRSNPNAPNPEGNRPAVQAQKVLLTPLPLVDWADRVELWENMLQKDVAYTRSPTCLTRHPTLQPRMRSILLSWMTEVCEVYKLHRETYYLAIDFLDRFLATSKQEIVKNNLQLVGITTLFVAAKIEEIYPPKIREFAYVTDGACLVEEIKRMELIILSTLDWQLCPLTVVGWLSTFLQVAYLSDMSGRELGSVEMVIPKYSRDFYTSIAQILDLCMLDMESLRFPYSHLAASALFHMSNENIVKAASGFSMHVLQPCIEWMRPFVDCLFERCFAERHIFEGIAIDEQHTIQQHCVNHELLERVQKKVQEQRRVQPQSEQRELFAKRHWQSFAESPMRLASQQQMPLTPMSTPPAVGTPTGYSKIFQMASGEMEMMDSTLTNFFNQ